MIKEKTFKVALQKDRKHLHFPFYVHHSRVNNDIASKISNAHKENLKVRRSAITPIAYRRNEPGKIW